MSHSQTILERLHDQFIREIDCDVILTSADHLEKSSSTIADVNLKASVVWKNLFCHRIVLRATSSFCDRIFSNNFTHDKTEVGEGIEGVLIDNENDGRASLQVILHRISLQSVQALVNFAYTGRTEIETNVLKRVIEDFKVMNLLSVIDKLDVRLSQDLIFSNCIPNLIISYTLDKAEKYREILIFILEEFFLGLKNEKNCGESWRSSLGSQSSVIAMNSKVVTELKKAAGDVAKLGIAGDIYLFNILLKLVENNCVTTDEESKLLTFLISKRREKCSLHSQNIMLYCYTDCQQLCVKCLVNGHVKHHIEPIGAAKHNQLAPCWEKMDLELEDVKESANVRLTEIDDLKSLLIKEEMRDIGILKNCAEIKPKLDRLSKIFESGDLDSNDTDVLAFELFVGVLKKESKRTKTEYEKAVQLAEKLMSIMQKRCASCASIADPNSEIETLEDFEEIDLDEPLSIKNCISVLKRAQKTNNQVVYNKAFNFLLTNFIDIVKQSRDSFHRRISPGVLKNLLKSDKLKVKSEDDIIAIVKEWLEFDFRQRSRFVTQLLKEIRFGCVTDKVLKQILADPSHIFMRNVESKLLLQNAIGGDCDRNNRECLAVRILAFGNDGRNLLFDSVKDTWERWKRQKQDNGRLFGVAKVSDNIFIIGGKNTASLCLLSKVSIYNVKTKTWKCGPNMLEARHDFGTCVSSANTIYVFGGFSKQGVKSVEMLNCDQNGEPIGAWQRVSLMKTARARFEVAIVDDLIYAIGGYPNLSTMEVFDPKANNWKDCRSKSQGCHDHAASTYNGEIYVISANGFCEKYNPTTDTWKIIASLNKSAETRGSIVLNDKIYLVGGDSCTETDIYDVETDTWSKGPPMPTHISWTKCVSF